MSIFDRIKNAIWKHDTPKAPPAQPVVPSKSAAPSSTTSTQRTASATPPASATTAAPSTPVDIEAVLEARSKTAGQTLNWRSSIVDLMKLVDLDPSLENRKELAREMGYSGDTGDSATMNVWLHKQVMKKLADSGGVVPTSLRD